MTRSYAVTIYNPNQLPHKMTSVMNAKLHPALQGLHYILRARSRTRSSNGFAMHPFWSASETSTHFAWIPALSTTMPCIWNRQALIPLHYSGRASWRRLTTSPVGTICGSDHHGFSTDSLRSAPHDPATLRLL